MIYKNKKKNKMKYHLNLIMNRNKYCNNNKNMKNNLNNNKFNINNNSKF